MNTECNVSYEQYPILFKSKLSVTIHSGVLKKNCCNCAGYVIHIFIYLDIYI